MAHVINVYQGTTKTTFANATTFEIDDAGALIIFQGKTVLQKFDAGTWETVHKDGEIH